MIGAFLPWESINIGFTALSRNGFQLGQDLSFSADGAWVLALGALSALAGITRLTDRPFPRWLTRSPLLLGIAIVWISWGDKDSIATTVQGLRVKDPSGAYAVGYGVWLVIVGGAVIVLASTIGWYQDRRYARKGESVTPAPNPAVDTFWNGVDAYREEHDE